MSETKRMPAMMGALVVWNAIVTLLGLWDAFWWGILAVNFGLVVMLAEAVETNLPARYHETYKKVLAFGFPVLLLITWELIVRAGILNPRWFPPPTTIGGALWELTVTVDRFSETTLLGRPWLIPQVVRDSGWEAVPGLFTESHVLATLGRVLAGFALGSAPGIVVGMLMGINRTIRTMLDSTLSAIYVLPKIAIFPLMMLMFPDPFGEGPRIAVVAISAFFLVAINTMAGVRGIDRVYLEAGRNYGANRLQMFRHVIFPGALPVIFSGLRLALGTSLIVIVAVEFIRSQAGIGYVIFYHWQILAPSKMYAGLFTVMIVGVVLTYGLQWTEYLLMRWRR